MHSPTKSQKMPVNPPPHYVICGRVRVKCRFNVYRLPQARFNLSVTALTQSPPLIRYFPSVAAMAELADALGSGPSTRKGVQVQLLLAAFKSNPVHYSTKVIYGVFSSMPGIAPLRYAIAFSPFTFTASCPCTPIRRTMGHEAFAFLVPTVKKTQS